MARFIIDSNLLIRAAGYDGDYYYRIQDLPAERVPAAQAQRAALGTIAWAFANGGVVVTRAQQLEMQGLCRQIRPSDGAKGEFLRIAENMLNRVKTPFVWSPDEMKSIQDRYPSDMAKARVIEQDRNAKLNSFKMWNENKVIENKFEMKSSDRWTDYQLYHAALATRAHIITADTDFDAIDRCELSRQKPGTPSRVVTLISLLDEEGSLEGVAARIQKSSACPDAQYHLTAVKALPEEVSNMRSHLVLHQQMAKTESHASPSR